jgi:beta-lactamase class A
LEADTVEPIEKVLDEILGGRDGVFAVMARDLKTGEEVLRNPDTLMPTASVFKVPVLVELFRKAGLGVIDLHMRHELKEEDKCPGSGVLKEMLPGVRLTFEDLAVLMIIISDNTATDLCVNAAGIYDINATMRGLGIANSYITMGCKGLLAYCAGIENPWPSNEEVALSFERLKAGQIDYDGLAFKGVKENNVTTVRDMVNLLQILYEGTKLPQEVCKGCLDVMKRQQLRDRIPGLLPLGTVTMTKSGTLGANVIVNDVGIVEPADGNPYAIAILTNQEPRDDSRQLPAVISRAIYDHFTGKNELDDKHCVSINSGGELNDS